LKYFQKFKAIVELAFPSFSIQAFRSDRGGEYISTTFTEYLQLFGIHRELTQAYTPHQNRISKRKNRTLLEKARSMFFEARTPRFLWAEAVNTENYLTNRSPTRANSGVSPYQRLYKNPPALHHLRIFGCLAFVHVHDKSRTKLEPKSHKCILVGYSKDTKGYRCYDPATHKIHVSGDVHFMEHCFLHSPADSIAPTTSVALEPLSDSSAAIQVFDPVLHPSDALPLPTVPAAPTTSVAPIEPVAPIESGSMVPDPSSSIANQASSPPLLIYVRRRHQAPPPTTLEIPRPPTPPTVPASSPVSHPPLRRSSCLPVPNSRFLDYVATVTSVTDAIACVHSMGEPRSYAQAATDPHWVAAMSDELTAIRDNNTWTLVPRPSAAKPLHVKWVYKLKTDNEGRPLLYKARLVARGDEQLAGVDFT
jgi:hypothetical protein